VRKTTNGTVVVNFSIAIDVGWGDQKKTLWVKCKWFGERAAKVAEYIKKGDRIGVSGEVSLDEWEAQDGSKRADLSVNVQNVTLLSSKQEGAPAGNAGGASTPKPAEAPRQATIEDSEIPFS
jgi:single-strand DNA-binding protein